MSYITTSTGFFSKFRRDELEDAISKGPKGSNPYRHRSCPVPRGACLPTVQVKEIAKSNAKAGIHGQQGDEDWNSPCPKRIDFRTMGFFDPKDIKDLPYCRGTRIIDKSSFYRRGGSRRRISGLGEEAQGENNTNNLVVGAGLILVLGITWMLVRK